MPLYSNNELKDKIIPTPSDAETIEESDIWRHLVFLRSNNDEIGIIGLLQYVKPGSGPEGMNTLNPIYVDRMPTGSARCAEFQFFNTNFQLN